jgi:DNA-binding transcriptional regulator YiaG
MKIGDTMSKTFAEMREEALVDPIERELIERESEAIRTAVQLAQIREGRQTTQVQLAALMGTSQANVSRIERSDNPYLSTLADYVAGLGGRLEINAVFDDDVVPVASVPTEVDRGR